MDQDFQDKVIEVVKDWFKTGGFSDRKLTDTPTDDLQVVNKKYCDSNSGGIYGRMYRAAAQNIGSMGSTKVAMDTANFSSEITADTTNSRFTALKAGYYAVIGHVLYDSPETAKNLIATIELNSSGNASAYAIEVSNGTNSQGVTVEDVVFLDVGNYVELFTFHNCTGTEALLAGSPYCYLSIYKV